MDRQDPDDKERMQLVRDSYERSRNTYGYRRIGIWIEKEHGIKINHKAVLRLMRKLQIRSIAREKNPYRQIQNRYGAVHTYPNQIRQDFSANSPNEKWGTDITYVRTQQGFVYLTIIKDFIDGSIVGYAMARNSSINMVMRALKSAISSSPTVHGVVLQSDQGYQYQSAVYHDLVSQNGIIPSMSRKGNCLDNAPTDYFFSHLKEELLKHIILKDFREAVQIVDDYIHLFNYDRIQIKT